MDGFAVKDPQVDIQLGAFGRRTESLARRITWATGFHGILVLLTLHAWIISKQCNIKKRECNPYQVASVENPMVPIHPVKTEGVPSERSQAWQRNEVARPQQSSNELLPLASIVQNESWSSVRWIEYDRSKATKTFARWKVVIPCKPLWVSKCRSITFNEMGSSYVLAIPTLRTHGSPSASTELRLEVARFMNTKVPHGGPPCKSSCSTKRSVYCNPRSHPDLRRARGTRHSLGASIDSIRAQHQLNMNWTWLQYSPEQ